MRWANDGERPHTVTSLSGPAFNSGIVMPGGAFARTFSRAGTFRYYCFLHDGMNGRVIVRAAAQPQPTKRPGPTRRPAGGGGTGATPPDTAGLGDVDGSGSSGTGGSTDGLLLILGTGALGGLLLGRRRLASARVRRSSRPWS